MLDESLLNSTPNLQARDVRTLINRLFNIHASLKSLPSERDQNFLLETDVGSKYVLKIANSREDGQLLEAQNQAMAHINQYTKICPEAIPAQDGRLISAITTPDGNLHFVRLLTFLDGMPMAKVRRHSDMLLGSLGKCLGQVSHALESFDHPAIHRDFHWDLGNGSRIIEEYKNLIEDRPLHDLMTTILLRTEKRVLPVLPTLRKSIIHNDANDYNVIVGGGRDLFTNNQSVTGLIDFGDMVFSYTVGDLAVTIAYALLSKAEPLAKAAAIVKAYHSEYPLTGDEIHILFDLVCLRLCMSSCIAAYQQSQRPDNDYLAVSQNAIATTLPVLVTIHPEIAEATFRHVCNLEPLPTNILLSKYQPRPPLQPLIEQTLAARQKLFGGNLSISYRQPLKIVRGWMQYLYDETGQEYLDAYNNVPHVGHCHPRVVAAGQKQMGLLNTNTRYLNDTVNLYAEKLCATLPEPLSVCFFVNSGSEANELALRLARTYTGRRDLVVLEHAYHGNTTTLIDISPYKHNGPGGSGSPSWVHTAPLPDTYRGPYRSEDPAASQKYADRAAEIIASLEKRGLGLAGFIAETCPGVAGQIFLPPNYLPAVYQAVHQAGGVCIADEVHTSFGRTGEYFYAFQAHGVVPDILVLGKPIGNGHPLGAVITTKEIAATFNNGMEFFSTFGGNTVSCAIGLAVLEIVQSEDMQANALNVGSYVVERLNVLKERYTIIGDVRGSGLYLGIELVRGRQTLEPAAEEAAFITERLREENILTGTDGPYHNVIKIRPPMPFSIDNADRLLNTLNLILWQDFDEG